MIQLQSFVNRSTGSLLHKKIADSISVDTGTVNRVCDAFQHSLKESIHHASGECRRP